MWRSHRGAALLEHAVSTGACSSSNAWRSWAASGQLALISDAGVPCTSSCAMGAESMRHLSTSSASCSKFQRVLRKPMPKAKVLNISNAQAWKESGMDVGVAQQMLHDGLVKKQQGSIRQAQRNIADLVKQAKSVAELQLIAEELGAHMMPSLISYACVCAVHMGAGSGLAGWQIQVQACLEEYTRNLVPRVSLLTTGQLSSVLYALSRAGYRDGRIGQTAMQELMAASGQRIQTASPDDVASIMLSVGTLGLQASEAGAPAWKLLTEAASRQLGRMQASQVAHVVRALGSAGDKASPLWAQAQSQLQSDIERWASDETEALASTLHTCASAGVAEPALLQAAASQLLGRGHVVDGRVPENLVGASPSALASLAVAYSTTPGDNAAQDMLTSICNAVASTILKFSGANLRVLTTSLARAGVTDERLVRLAADVLRIRGFQELGADAAASVLHSLVQMGMRDASVAQVLAAQMNAAVAGASPRSLALIAWSLATIKEPKGAAQRFLEASSDRLAAAAGSRQSDLCPSSVSKALCALALVNSSGGELTPGLKNLAVKLADKLAAFRSLHGSIKDVDALKELRIVVPQSAAGLGVPTNHPLLAALSAA